MAASADTPVLDLLTNMTAESVVVSSLDPQSLMVARVAALVATDAPAISYVLNLEAAVETGIDAAQVRGVLTAIAPIVGTARVASALGKIADALEIELETAELESQSQE
jgi:4-carboxymuconolactone decarboxylase